MRGLLLFVVLAFSALALEPIPDKTVVLTFDDSPKSHHAFVGPLLKELGFGATFFVSARWMDDTKNFMTWDEIAALHAMGFEIGNHSWSHLDFGDPANAARLAGQLALVENELAHVGVPKPTAFAWCGNSFGPEARAVLAENGYIFARRGMQPEIPYGQARPGPLFVPGAYHPLLLPTAGDAYPNWTLENFTAVVDRARDGGIAVVQFHGVPDDAHPWVSTPEERFREYMAYLKEGGFNVIAVRDLARYVDPAAEVADAMTQVHYGPKSLNLPQERLASRANADYWLKIMLQGHRYAADEAATVFGWPVKTVEGMAAGLSAPEALPRVLPYPGGRHPRVGFLDGAIDPQRGTKASIFSPWGDGGYALIDLPEAIFSNLGLLYLAHTHVPTVWDEQHVLIENRDWRVRDDGGLENTWALPNGVRFGAMAAPAKENGADFTLWLENGTKEPLTALRTQVCVMLKGLPGFEGQTEENKEFTAHSATAKEAGGRRVVVEFEQCGRAWGNPKCPCIHADPVLPDCAPGARVMVRGTLRFEGK